MIDELIEIIGIDKMKHEIINESKMENAIYVKIQLDGTVNKDDILITKAKDERKDMSVKDIKKLKWFKEREFFGEAIKNKSIRDKETKKATPIISNQKNLVIYGNKKIKNNSDEEYIEEVSRYINGYLGTLGSLDENVFEKAIKSNIDILASKDYLDFRVNLVLNKDKDDFEKEFKLYSLSIPNDVKNNNIKKKLDKIEEYPIPLFVSRNTSKPLIINKNLNSSEINLTKNEDIYNYLVFYKYIKNKKVNTKECVKTKKGEVSFRVIINNATKCKFVENVSYTTKSEKELDRQVSVLGIAGGKDFTIEDINSIKTTLWLLAKTNAVLGKKEKDKKLEDFRRNFGYIEKSLERGEMDLFKRDFDKMMKKLIKIHLNSCEDENKYKINNILEFDIAMGDYINKTRKGKEIVRMIEKSIIKIKNLKAEEYMIESNEEFNFLVGQVASYLKGKSKAKEKTNKLIRDYLKVEKLEEVMKLICKDFAKHTSEEKEFSRINKIYGKILEYSISEKVEFDKKMFMIGLINTKKIMYVEGDK